ncbi:hypothetical protein F4810DRAFT_412524 [Camillea tinctor]|nr:hypothetical protein F4810DRAFT_412524 [Camillea tinctor]
MPPAISNGCSEIGQSQWLAIPSITDISGAGVLTGFITPAYILLGIVVIYYIVTYQPSLDPFRKYGDQHSRVARPNPVDEIVLRGMRKLLMIGSPQNRRPIISASLQRVFEKCVLSMADIQIVTGVGIMTAGYVSRAELSAFHWKMVVYLAWFSCTSHLSALTFLGNYLVNRPISKIVRLCVMFGLLVLLVVALIPTGHFYWYRILWVLEHYSELSNKDINYYDLDAPPSANATCYLNATFGPEQSRGRDMMIISVFLLVVGFISRLCRLLKPTPWIARYFAPHALISKVLGSAAFFQRCFGTARTDERFVSNIVVAAHFVFCILVDLYTSMLSDVCFLIVSHVWGTISIEDLRRILAHSTLAQDRTWSFGQVLPVVLLAGPCITLLEHCIKVFWPWKISRIEMRDHSTTPTESVITLPDQPSPADLLTTNDNTMESPGTSVSWNLRPESFDDYYTKSIWPVWIILICNAHSVYLLHVIISPRFLPNIYHGPVDIVARVGLVVVWFIFTQGSVLHILTVLLSFLEARLNQHRRAMHAVMFVTSGGFTALSLFSLSAFTFYTPYLAAGMNIIIFLVAATVKFCCQVIRSSRCSTGEDGDGGEGHACLRWIPNSINNIFCYIRSPWVTVIEP